MSRKTATVAREQIPEMVAEFARVLGDDERATKFERRWGPLDNANRGTKAVRDRSADLRNVVAYYGSLQFVAGGNPRGLKDLRSAKGGPGSSATKAVAVKWAQERIVSMLSPVPNGIAASVDRPARFVLAAQPSSLLQQIHAAVAGWMVRGEPLAICSNPKHHGELFFKTDKRMRFCSRRCRIEGQYQEAKEALAKARRSK